jgi:hypothetical protein
MAIKFVCDDCGQECPDSWPEQRMRLGNGSNGVLFVVRPDPVSRHMCDACWGKYMRLVAGRLSNDAGKPGRWRH